MLTAPGGLSEDDLRLTSGLRLTPAFGVQIGHRRALHDVPAFGTPEHLALLSGSIDLEEIERAAQGGPLVGFAPIVLDSRGAVHGEPADHGLADRGLADRGLACPSTAPTCVLPSRRSLRTASAPPSLGRPLAEGLAAGSGLPLPRAVLPSSGATTLTPLARSGRPVARVAPSTGALRAKDVEQALAACPTKPVTDDPTPTGELARPFVDGTPAREWHGLEDVPPPVSVDIFQRAVRAGLALEDADRLDALGDELEAGARGRCARSRRETRARERATTTTRSVTARRIAKGGVLAITALGVVSGATPQGLSAFGISKDSTASHNTIDFATSIAPETTAPVLSQVQVDQLRRSSLMGHLESELTQAKAADAVHAGMLAGGSLAQLGQEQDQRMLAEREVVRQRAIRDAISNPQGYARMAAAERGWGATQFQCLNSLWAKESGWSYTARNPSSGAYGIAQALPGSRMNVVGPDWLTSPITQIKWGMNYIADRYGTPCGAWAHSQSSGWY